MHRTEKDDIRGHDPGLEPLSEEELRRERKHYGPKENPAYEPENMNEKERSHSGGKDGGIAWPHRDVTDIGESLVEAEAENASVDQNRTEKAAKGTLGKEPHDLESDVGTPGTSDDAGAGKKGR